MHRSDPVLSDTREDRNTDDQADRQAKDRAPSVADAKLRQRIHADDCYRNADQGRYDVRPFG